MATFTVNMFVLYNYTIMKNNYNIYISNADKIISTRYLNSASKILAKYFLGHSFVKECEILHSFKS